MRQYRVVSNIDQADYIQLKKAIALDRRTISSALSKGLKLYLEEVKAHEQN